MSRMPWVSVEDYKIDQDRFDYLIFAYQEKYGDNVKDTFHYNVNDMTITCNSSPRDIEVYNKIEDTEGYRACIVNPTDDKFETKGGVSTALKEKGGLIFQELLENLRSNNRDMKICECRSSTAGDLTVDKVIHDDECMDTIVFPFLYTGKLGCPVKQCISQYAYAILEYSRSRKDIMAGKQIKIRFVSDSEHQIKEALSVFNCTLPQTYEQLFKIIPVLEDTNENRRNGLAVSQGYESLKLEKAEMPHVLKKESSTKISVVDGEVSGRSSSQEANDLGYESLYEKFHKVDYEKTSLGFEYFGITDTEVADTARNVDLTPISLTASSAFVHETKDIETEQSNAVVKMRRGADGHEEQESNTESVDIRGMTEDSIIGSSTLEHETRNARKKQSVPVIRVLQADIRLQSSLDNFCGKIEVVFVKKDIRSFSAVAIVCPMSGNPDKVSGNDLMGVAIKATYHSTFLDSKTEGKLVRKLGGHRKHKKLVTWTPCQPPVSESKRTRTIFHVIFPVYDGQGISEFQSVMTMSLKALFEKVQKESKKKKDRIHELCFPFFGLDTTSKIDDVKVVCRAIARGFRESLTKFNNTKYLVSKVYFVNWCPHIISILEDSFKKIQEDFKKDRNSWEYIEYC